MAKEMLNLAYAVSLFTSAGFFNMPQSLMTWTDGFYFPSEGRLAKDFYRP
jgi:hypothetical protein